MKAQFTKIVQRLCEALSGVATADAPLAISSSGAPRQRAVRLIAIGGLAVAAYVLYAHPPVQSIDRGEIGVRLNHFTGESVEVSEGAVLVVPRLHELRRFSLRDQLYRPADGVSANGSAPFQSVEGLSLGVDVSVRYALDRQQIAAIARTLPEDISNQVVDPLVRGVLYKTLARYTVREVFSSKRQEIEQVIEHELKTRLAANGIVLDSVSIGKVDLPADFKAGMESLLAEGLATEKMRYTLELKDKQVRESELEAEAEKVRREKAAEAAGQEQIIAAKAQAEAMKHVLPFKQKQIEQRALEAEAEKTGRIKNAEATAQARRIEAAGEADSRQKLADADAYRQERLGKIANEQLARDGALISKNPLLIQKTLADKLSDKISVIIAPPPSDGGFIGATLLGSNSASRDQPKALPRTDPVAAEDSAEQGR